MNRLYRPRVPVAGFRPRKRRLNPKILLFFILLIVLSAAVFLTIRLANPATGTLNGGVDMPFSAGGEYFVTSGGVAYVSGTDLIAIDYKGQPLWNATLAFADADTTHSSSMIGAWKGSSAQFFSADGKELFKNDFLGNIQLVRCGVNYAAVLSKTDTGESTLVVLNTEGGKLQELPMSQENLLDFGFTGELDMLWTLTLDTEGVVPISKITTYNSERNSITGVTSINDQIPHKLSFTSDEIFVIGTNHIMWYNYLGQKKDSHLVYGWELAGGNWGTAPPTLVFRPRSDSATQDAINTVRVIRPGVEESSYNLPPHCFSVALGNNKLYAFTPDNLYAYAFDSDTRTQYAFDTKISAAYPVGQTHTLVETLNGLELIALP